MDRPTASRLTVLSWIVVLALGASSCANSPEIESAPLADARQKKLRETLVGTWEHRYTVPEGGERTPVQGTSRKWTFQKDGTGSFHGLDPANDETTEWKFDWHLEGRNLVLERRDSGDTTYFRAETWSFQQMRWFHYAGGDQYIVHRVTDSDRRNQPGTTVPAEAR